MALLMVVLAGCASDPGGAKDEADTAPDDTGAVDTHTGCCDIGDSADSAGDTDTAVDTDTGGDTDTGVTDTGPAATYDLAGASYIYEGATAWQVLRGDLDGDGWDDLLLGDPMLYRGTSCSPGRAVLVRGPLTEGVLDVSEDSETVWSFWGSEAGPLDETTGVCEVGEEAGTALARADLDADGVIDLVVGALYADAAGADAGAVYLLPGPLTAGANLADTPTQIHGRVGDAAGAHIAVGDITGDGWEDLLVGTPTASAAGERAGGVMLFPGPLSEGLHSGDEGVRFDGVAAGDYAGRVAAGDLDGDGIADAVIGASGSATVYLLRGPLDAGGSLDVAEGRALVDDWGHGLRRLSVTAAQDVDGDGYGDWMVGAVSSVWGDGVVWVVPGFATGTITSGDALGTVVAGTYVELGRSVAFPGDVDADGHPDMLVGASNRAYLFYGPPGGVLEAGVDGPGFIHWEERAGEAVAGAGDVDGDGGDDLLIGGTFYGAWIVLASEL